VSELAAGHLVVVPVEGWDCRRDLFLVQRASHTPTRAEQAFLALLSAFPPAKAPSPGSRYDAPSWSTDTAP
jgi:hypothetical protein